MYSVDLDQVVALEISIVPDISGGQAKSESPTAFPRLSSDDARSTYNGTFFSCFSERCGHVGHQLSRACPWGASAKSRSHTQSNEPRERRRPAAAVLPGLRRANHRDDRQGSEQHELLALSGLRRDLDPCSTPDSDVRTVAPVTDPTASVAINRTRIVRELHELIAALDRRVPQVHRMGEVAIARAAAALRAEARKRIEELEGDAAVDVRTVDAK